MNASKTKAERQISAGFRTASQRLQYIILNRPRNAACAF
ncbi:hypothetical protein SC1_00425 [Sphingopyxis sp. C-1]|nr:hypothetical protein SC1_00425 [Sphingopyxis sp. C-1]